jgi:hypothetical protein
MHKLNTYTQNPKSSQWKFEIQRERELKPAMRRSYGGGDDEEKLQRR